MYRIRDWLYIGGYRDASDASLLDSHGINAALHLISDITPPANVECLRTPVEDGEPLPIEQLKRGVAFVRAQKAQERRVLVACGAGISRSVSFSMAVLHEEEGLSLMDTYRAIHQHHSGATPHPELLTSLFAYYNDPMTWEAFYSEMYKLSRGD
jgi:predicted protein tyrosine phosphatase